MSGNNGRPGPAAAPLDLAALHGKDDVIAAGIAGNNSKLHAKRTVEHSRELDGVVAGAGAANSHLRFENIFDFRDFRNFPGSTNAHFIVSAANPTEFGGLELGARKPEQRVEGNAATDRSEYSPVLRRDFGEPIRQSE